MPNYQIIDWYYDNILDEDDLTRLDKIEKKIRANDAKGTAALWMQGSADWSKNIGPKSAQSFQDIVDTKNEVQKTLIQDEIASATTEEELEDIKIGDYEDIIVNELTESINTKIKELEEVVTIVEIDGREVEIPESFRPGRPRSEVAEIAEQLAGEFLADVQAAQAKENISNLRDLTIPASPKDIKEILQESLDEAIDSVESVLEAKEAQKEFEES